MSRRRTVERPAAAAVLAVAALLACALPALAADPPNWPAPAPTAASASASASAPATDATQSVEIVAQTRAARAQKTVAQLLEAQAMFDRHRALAPQASLAFRLYARLDSGDLARLRLAWVSGDERRPVALDDHQRFTLDPAWTAPGADRGAVLQANLPDDAVAWKVDIHTPGFSDDRRRLGDLRLECEADLFHGNLQRAIRSPGAALMSMDDTFCTLDDAEFWYAERPVFGVTLRSGARERRLPYRYLHASDGTMALATFFDWPYALRDRTYFLPLDERSWPDDTEVDFDYMDDPQPIPLAVSSPTPASAPEAAP